MTFALRGEGVPSKADIISNVSKGGCVNLRTRGEEVKKSLRINGSPLTKCSKCHLEMRRVINRVQYPPGIPRLKIGIWPM